MAKVSQKSLQNLKPKPKIAEQGTAPKPVQVRILKDRYELWMSLPAAERNNYLREAIDKYLIEKNMFDLLEDAG